MPDPLWIFGYGSLCWKADFPFADSFVGRVSGWGRWFAQRSTDHRGTPAKPGLVATLLTDQQLEALSLRPPGAPRQSTCGVCYRISPSDAATVLDGLDFREKGGYTRELIDVTPAGGDGPPVRALLYSATPDNPGFAAEAIADLGGAAATIGAAHGPSGANREYLLQLASWLEQVAEQDAHVEELVRLMELRE